MWETDCFPPKISNMARRSVFTILTQYNPGCSCHWNKARKIKDKHIRKKEIKLFSDDIIVYIGNR